MHHAIGIVDVDDDSLELESSEKQDPVYDISEDEARLDPEAAACAEENNDKSEGQNPLKSEDEIVLAEPAGRHQVRADIYSQISILSVNGCEYFKCNTRPQRYKCSAGTKNIRDHLLKRHGWTSLTGVQNKRKRENERIKDVVKRMGPAVEERRNAFRKKLLSESLDKETLEYLFVLTVILCDHHFNLVQNHTFPTWLEYVNSAANDFLPNSCSTIRARMMSLYEEGQRRIYLVLQDALSSIHISYDVWTSPNDLEILGIVSHLTNEERRLQALLLALVKVERAHTGKQVDAHIFMVLDQYHIKDRLGDSVMDNATSNDRMLTSISHQLFDKDGLSYNSQQHRLRCNSHIIILSVQAFLFGPLPEDVILGGGKRDEESPTTAELQRWRKMGQLRKLHNIVISIKASP